MNKDRDIIIDDNDEDLDESVVTEEHSRDTLKKLREKVKAAEEKAKEYLDGWQRDRAEIANVRKRDEEARKEFAKFAVSAVLEDLLPVLDSFELSLPHGNKELEVIYKQLKQILKSHGLEESNPVGEAFDPRLHESVGSVTTDKPEDDHKILEVAQKGYILSGKIIRPAKVRIGEFSS